VDPACELAVLADLTEWCQHHDQAAVLAGLGRLRADAARPDVNLMDATLACARAGVTTGEWSSRPPISASPPSSAASST